MSAEKGTLVRKVANLSLNSLGFDQDMPTWDTRQEAMGACVVYILWVDGKTRDGESNFDDQLQGFEDSLAHFRSTTKARLRPVKAVLLLYQSSATGKPRAGLEKWALTLSDFEHANGDLWKFGPLCMEDPEALHATFAEMTSARLKYAQNAPEDPAEEPAEPVPAGQEQDIYKFKPSAGNHMRGSAASDAGSSLSEQELPPAFEAEASGSECSESALELHRMVFGLTRDDGGGLHEGGDGLDPYISQYSSGGDSAENAAKGATSEAETVGLLSPEA